MHTWEVLSQRGADKRDRALQRGILLRSRELFSFSFYHNISRRPVPRRPLLPQGKRGLARDSVPAGDVLRWYLRHEYHSVQAVSPWLPLPRLRPGNLLRQRPLRPRLLLPRRLQGLARPHDDVP